MMQGEIGKLGRTQVNHDHNQLYFYVSWQANNQSHTQPYHPSIYSTLGGGIGKKGEYSLSWCSRTSCVPLTAVEPSSCISRMIWQPRFDASQDCPTDTQARYGKNRTQWDLIRSSHRFSSCSFRTSFRRRNEPVKPVPHGNRTDRTGSYKRLIFPTLNVRSQKIQFIPDFLGTHDEPNSYL